MNRIARNYRNRATQSPNFLINSLSSNHQKTSQISSNRKLNSSSNLQIRKGKTFTRWATSKLANSSSNASKPKDLPPSNSSNNDNPDDFDDGHDPKDKPNIGVIVDEIPDTTKSNKNNKETNVVPHTAPHYLPYTPIVALNNHPLYPDFVKVISITDPNLQKLIQMKIDQKFPYLTVVCKRDDDNLDEVVNRSVRT